ncbi:exodeoxyribonuclease III [Mesorhizobium sp. M7D.F.Ca.US.005.01.1.1]|uniref:Exodeoxyribonuclease-3 n=1 Tax=Rhizobium loti TaxID=381 RepID=A0A8E2WAP9_RHILI|nr:MULTISPECIES: exodeoxyribonuclease III [Mesorhizobium]AZO41437.1 exodeoxyribonuclease III [Mesorhizobium sp. M7D.F.Ca.US.005.01.1.1]PWJ88000.1 exodeoxyribonuclease-3 [Mesorhizobium loti]
MIRIATFNLNGVNGRLPVLIKWLGQHDYDIVCLQELKTSDEKFPAEAIRNAGYGAIWHGQKSYNGVAILARGKMPLERRRGLPGDSGDTHSRYIEAEVDGVVVGCLYLPNGNPAPGPKFDYKLRWFDRLISYSQLLLTEGVTTVLCGDYNVVPTPIDAAVPRRWVGDAVYFPESRRAYAKMLGDGWIDAVRRIHPEKGIYTYWNFSYGGGYDRSSGLRMDHLLLSPALSTSLRDAGVDAALRAWEKPSDHAPAWIELDLPGNRKTPSPTADKSSILANFVPGP